MKNFILTFLMTSVSVYLFAQTNCCNSFTASASRTTVCPGGTTQLGVIGDPCGEFEEFLWVPGTSGGTLNNPNIRNPIATLTSTTTFFLRHDSEGCPAETVDLITITVEAFEGAQFNVNTTYCLGDTPDLLPTTSTNGITGQWSPSSISTASVGFRNYNFVPNINQCSANLTLVVEVKDVRTPTFNVETEYCQNATPDVLPNSSLEGISGSWNPSTISTTTVGLSTYTFTPITNCDTQAELEVNILPRTTPEFDLLTDYCVGDTPEDLPEQSDNGISGSWDPSIISTSTDGTEVYEFIPDANECSISIELGVVTVLLVTPSFNVATSYCVGSTADVLPTTSSEGITGSWDPDVISTLTAVTTEYTFTPDMGQCASIISIDVLIEEEITPTFNIQINYCVGDVPESLPALSDNGISGTWNPNTISTLNDGTQVYEFTPDAIDCAISIELEVVTELLVTPSFNFETLYCEGNSAEDLPTTSSDGITGFWDPEVISTFIIGTTEYTFTPDMGQCATVISIDIFVEEKITPTFNIQSDYCVGDTPEDLTEQSENGVLGTWDPNIISTSSNGSQIFVFTPDANECAEIIQLEVVIISQVTPSFNISTAYCEGNSAEELPVISSEGFSGLWDPEVISTFIIGTTEYTFTPDIGQCASIISIDVFVEEKILPTFNIQSVYCLGDTPEGLTEQSDNGIFGSWNPNTISTSSDGSQLYVFTPDANECADIVEVEVVIDLPIIPDFDFETDYCSGDMADALPNTSINGISGTWNPSTISTNGSGNLDYIFTPDPELCATLQIVAVEVDQCDCADPPGAIAGNDQLICSGEVVSLMGTITGSANSAIWSSQGSGMFNNPNDLNTVYTPSSADITNGTVSLLLTTEDPDGSGPCSFDTDAILVVIDNLSSEAGDDQTICFNESVQLCANQEPGVIYNWSTGEQTRCIDVRPLETSDFTIVMTRGDCEDTDEVTVNVSPELVVTLLTTTTIEVIGGTPPYADTSFTTMDGMTIATVTDANGCTADDTMIATSSSNLLKESDIHIYPNPTSDRFYIKYPENINRDYQIKIISADGRVMKSINGSPEHLSLHEISPGLYYVYVFNHLGFISIPLIKMN